MALPLTVESVVSAARDAAIASLHELLRDRLSTAAPVRRFMIKKHTPSDLMRCARISLDRSRA